MTADVANAIPFAIGALVNVEARTWPGINKLGGVGRITRHTIEDLTVDVKYILGGEEKGIDLEFVSEHKFEDNGGGNGGRASRRRRNHEQSQTEQSAENNRQQKKKRALKDASSQANKIEKKTIQKPKNVGVKRKANEAVEKSQQKNPTVNLKKKKSNRKTKSASRASNQKTNNEKSEILEVKTNPTSSKRAKSNTKSMKRKDQAPASIVQNTDRESSNGLEKVNPVSPSTVSNEDRSNSNKWKIPSPTRVLKNVYKDMLHGATSFVNEIVGKKERLTPCSPESTSSIDIKIDKGRESEFDGIFSAIMRQKMADSIELDKLKLDIRNKVQKKPFTELEIKQHLKRLDQNNKIMISSDCIYIL